MITLDELYLRTPVNLLSGGEIIPLQKDSTTGATLLSAIKNFVKGGFIANDITNATSIGKQILLAANASAIKTLLGITELSVFGGQLASAEDATAARAILGIASASGPMTIAANATLNVSRGNRNLYVTEAGVELTTSKTGIANTDFFQIYNVSDAVITLKAGTDELLMVAGSEADVAEFEIPARSSVKIFLVSASVWFVEI